MSVKIHWQEGLFLQPHHLQRMQKSIDDILAAERRLAWPYPFGIIEARLSRDELEMMESHAWLVNVARGKHIVTDDLVHALTNGIIGGAGLDVTEPEPLPDGHPLWTLPNCIITPHVGNTPEMAIPLLSERITQNVRLFARGQDLLGPVHADLGY